MDPNTRNSVRALHDTACRSETAETRCEARDILDGLARREGYAHVGAMLDALGLDLDAFFGSLPILR